MWIPIGSLSNSGASVEPLVRFAMASRVLNLSGGLIITAITCVLIVLGNVECKAQKLSDAVVWTNGKAYLFYDTGQYVRYDIANDRADEHYPKHIAGNWPGVWENKIDAALTWNNGKAYFFKGNQYIRYDIARDRADEGYPADISTFWHGLWDKDIDAAVMWNDGFAYFFKGDEVMQYDIREKHRPKKLKITDRFKGVWASDIDAAVLWNSTTAFFFKGDEYIRYDVKNNRALEGYPRRIRGNWGGLSFNQAAYFGWRGYADTNLRFGDFFDHDHTILARFMPQYAAAYAGPIVAESSNGTYVIGQARYSPSAGFRIVMKVGGKEQIYASPLLASGTWVNLAVVRSGNTFKLFINGVLMQPAIVIDPRDKDLPAADNRLRLGRRRDGKGVNDSEAQFYGLIDDVVVLKKALNQSEIIERQSHAGVLRRDDVNVHAGAWIFDEMKNPSKVLTDSKIVFKTLTPDMAASGLTLVSFPIDSKTDGELQPLPFQRSKRQLPFKPGQAWKVVQGMNEATGASHWGIAAFAIDFVLAGDESKNKVPNPNSTAKSCGEPVYASATGWVAQINDVGRGGPDKDDFDEPNYLYIEHARDEEESYAHMFTSFNMTYIQPKDRDKDGRILIKKGEQVGTVGALNGCHLHTGVFTKDNEIGVDFPQEYNDYEVSDDDGSHWRRVERGTPKKGQLVRRPLN